VPGQVNSCCTRIKSEAIEIRRELGVGIGTSFVIMSFLGRSDGTVCLR
jgi:hypothetical protein